jgi:hypothetical protein
MINNRFFICGILLANLCSLVAMEKKDPLKGMNQEIDFVADNSSGIQQNVDRAIERKKSNSQATSFSSIFPSKTTSWFTNRATRKVSRATAQKSTLIKTIGAQLNAITLADIEKTDVAFTQFNGRKSSVAYLFVHGHGGNRDNAHVYCNMYAPGSYGYATFNFPEIEQNNWKLANLGQNKDIFALYCAFKKTISILLQKGVVDPIVIPVSLSRGASATINFLGVMTLLRPHDLRYIKAALIESAFAHMNHIYKHVSKSSLSSISNDKIATKSADVCESSIEGIGKVVVKFAAPGYSPKGIHPQDVIVDISPEIALLFISSKKDTLIPSSSTESLYQKRISKGVTVDDHLVLENGEHGNLFAYPEYTKAAHTFYRKNTLPHDKNKI